MLSKRPPGAQAGLSLVETVFTVMVLALLLSMAVPSYNSWIERHRVRAVTETMHASLQLARAETMARNATVRIAIADRGSWGIACTTITPGCPDLVVLHQRDGAKNTGSFDLVLTPSTAGGVTFGPQGRPAAVGITQLDVVNAASVHPRVSIGSAGWVNIGSAPTLP